MSKSRLRLAAVAAAASLSLLAACSSGGPTAPSTERPEKFDLVAGVYGDARRGDIYQQALNLWAGNHEGVTATLEFAERGPYYERLSANAAAKKLPDVFWLNDSYFTRYATNGLLLDLTPYLGTTINTEQMGEKWLNYGKLDDAQYGLVSHFNGAATIIDDRLFDAKSLKYEAKTWEEAFATGAKLTDPANGVYGVEDISISFSQIPLQAYVRQRGEELFNDEGKLGFKKETLVDWWKMWDEARKAGILPPPDVQIESQASTANALLTHGKVAIRFSSATHAASFGGLRDGGLSVSKFPETADADEDWRMFTALMLVAGANTAAPSLTADAMNFLVNDKEAAKITQLSMGIPTPADVAEAITPLLKDADVMTVEFLTEAQSFPSRRTPLVPEQAESVYDAIMRAAQEVAYGRVTPEQAADNLFTEADGLLAG